MRDAKITQIYEGTSQIQAHAASCPPLSTGYYHALHALRIPAAENQVGTSGFAALPCAGMYLTFGGPADGGEHLLELGDKSVGGDRAIHDVQQRAPGVFIRSSTRS
jgi:hypothetical protein